MESQISSEYFGLETRQWQRLLTNNFLNIHFLRVSSFFFDKNVKDILLSMCDVKVFLIFTSLNLVLL